MAYCKDVNKPMFDHLVYCVRCGMPSSEEDSNFDELGICVSCQNQEMKMRIDWEEREKAFSKLIEDYRGKGDYDCIVAISGGKDSAWQLHVLTSIYKVKPLAVTYSHNWFSEVGMKNLRWCLETFDVDHIMFTPSRSLVNKTARRSLEMIGDSCWQCHAGVGAFPWQIAVKYNIPLMLFGESTAENSCKGSYKDLPVFDRDYFLRVSTKVPIEKFANDHLSLRELSPYRLPSHEEVNNVGVLAVHMGNYFFWDAEKQTEILVERYGWKENRVEGNYKRYKSVECIMPGMHDYTKFLKRGYGRSADFVAQDRRAGLMTEREANRLVRQFDPIEPDILKYYLEITGYTKEEFYTIMDQQREKLGKMSKEDIEQALEAAKAMKKDSVKDVNEE